MAAAKKPAARKAPAAKKPAARKAPAAKKPAPAKPKAPNPQGHRIAEAYEEIKNGDGVIRVEPGHVIVDTSDGPMVMPPERFAEFCKEK